MDETLGNYIHWKGHRTNIVQGPIMGEFRATVAHQAAKTGNFQKMAKLIFFPLGAPKSLEMLPNMVFQISYDFNFAIFDVKNSRFRR